MHVLVSLDLQAGFSLMTRWQREEPLHGRTEAATQNELICTNLMEGQDATPDTPQEAASHRGASRRASPEEDTETSEGCATRTGAFGGWRGLRYPDELLLYNGTDLMESQMVDIDAASQVHMIDETAAKTKDNGSS